MISYVITHMNNVVNNTAAIRAYYLVVKQVNSRYSEPLVGAGYSQLHKQ